ncbi:MAG: patatin-like phospholipase family protein [Spirulinaceae cyanobacterium RM2_2_10]|nr:patatin-like phospholipase family protein [Spirulinaceae cyanobacterium RM2_2_10]
MVYRILSLDGGGIRGTISAQILSELEGAVRAETGQALHEYFQLIAGTSTGSILAAGLAIGKSGTELVDLYRQNGRRIFPYWGLGGLFSPRRLSLLVQSGLSAPKFSHDGLRTVLQEQYGDRRLAEVTPSGSNQPKLLITAYDTVTRYPLMFKSWRHAEWYASIYLWEASLCSSSAPTYFPAYQLVAGDRQCSAIDGGVGANNPTACAIAEAVRLGHSLADLRVFSIGTGQTFQSYPYREVKHWGAAQWGKRIVDVLMDAPQKIDAYVAQKIMASTPLGDRAYARLHPP